MNMETDPRIASETRNQETNSRFNTVLIKVLLFQIKDVFVQYKYVSQLGHPLWCCELLVV